MTDQPGPVHCPAKAVGPGLLSTQRKEPLESEGMEGGESCSESPIL